MHNVTSSVEADGWMNIALTDMQGVTLATGGDGNWSTRIADVKIDSIAIGGDSEHGGFVNVCFDRSTWNDDDDDAGGLINRNVVGDGLIYGDKTWLRNLHNWLTAQGMTASEVEGLGYTEQGMQDVGMVSLEADEEFFTGFARTFAK